MSNDPSGRRPQQLVRGGPSAPQPEQAWSARCRMITGIGALVTLVALGGVVSGSGDQVRTGKPGRSLCRAYSCAGDGHTGLPVPCARGEDPCRRSG